MADKKVKIQATLMANHRWIGQVVDENGEILAIGGVYPTEFEARRGTQKFWEKSAKPETQA